MDFNEDSNIESVAVPVTSGVVEVNGIEPVIQAQMQGVTPKPAIASTKQLSIWEWKTVPTTASNTLFNTNFAPTYAEKTYNDIWKKNFGYALGPLNPAFIDAQISYQDVLWNYHLEPNPNGVLWRVNAAGIPVYEDLNKYFEQNRIIESTTNRTIEELRDNKSLFGGSISITPEVSRSSGNESLTQQNTSAEAVVNKSAVKKPEATNVSFTTKLGTQFEIIKFDPQKAVEYALKYATSPNIDEYPDFGDNDCTNFVSQCWAYAGIPTSTDWFCTKIKRVYTNSWTDVEGFANYMVKENYCYISYSSKDAKIGDVIQFYNDKDGWHHSAIVTEIDRDGNIKYSGHSNAQNNRYLYEVYPQSGEQIRFLCVNRGLRDYAPDIPIA
ncbi:hypothetical protein HA075_01485 [bacterium BFN5]|nr:hypothetical protein HA075_01100 [bacterium BFN5]QJW44625.1 hypothetical protein HA075_01485 [bacterium BFN5]